jgi:hypothetical protein
MAALVRPPGLGRGSAPVPGRPRRHAPERRSRHGHDRSHRRGRGLPLRAPEGGQAEGHRQGQEDAAELRGDGFREGDYRFSLDWKTPRRLRFKNLDTSEGLQELDFAAEEGTEVDVKAKARKKSASRPVVFQLLRLEGDDSSTVKTFTFPTDPQKTHVVAADILQTGDHRLIVRDGGGFGGPTDVTVKLKTLTGKRAIDVTDDVLEPPPAGVEIVSTILVDADGGATPDGVPALSIPRNAVARLSPIQLGVGDEFEGPDGRGLLPVGPGIYVGPESVEFDRLIEVTVPFDRDAFPGTTSELRIVRLEFTGLRTVLDAQSVVVDDDSESAACPIFRGGMYGAFRLVPPPSLTSVTPFSGSTTGGFTVTLGGENFRDARDENGDRYLQITRDGTVIDVEIIAITPTLVSFVAPAYVSGKVTWGVHDRETDLDGQLPVDSFLYL